MPPTRPPRPAHWALTALGAASTLLLAACSSSTVTSQSAAVGSTGAVQVANPPSIAITPSDGSGAVRIDDPVTVVADRGALDTVAVHTNVDPTPLAGTTSADGHAWTLSAALDPGTTYVVEATAHDSSGSSARARPTLSTM